MADEEVEQEEKKDAVSESDAVARECGPGVSDPEIGRTGKPISFPKLADRIIAKEFHEVVLSMGDFAKKGNVQAAKFLLELASLVNAEEEVPMAVYQSFAEVLWKAYEEQEAGNGE